MSESTHSELTEPRIWSSVIRDLQLPLTEHGVDFRRLLKDSGIGEDDINMTQGKIPLKRYLNFMEQASRVAEDPLIGIKLARRCGPQTLGAVGFLFLSSRTLSEAMSDFCSYLNLLQDTTDFRCTMDRTGLTFHYQVFGVPDVECRQDVEFSIALTSRLIRMFGGAEIEMSHVCFRHSPSVQKSEYQRYLNVEPRFNQESNSVTVAAEMASVRSNAIDSSLSDILKDFLDGELARRGRIHSFSDQIRHMLLNNRITPPITAEKTAERVGVSTATLYRRLKIDGTTFGRLRNEIGFELARDYLGSSELSITQIAQAVGFIESASFTRAFSRWTNGVTPSQYRDSLR